MNKLFRTLAIAALALALPLAALAQNNLNLDTGAAVSSGGDITFNPGANIAPVGNAMLADLTTQLGSEFSILASSGEFETILVSEPYSTTPIPASSLVQNEAIAVQTNGGNYAGVLVKAASSGSITLQFFTYNTSGKQIQTGTVTLGGPAPPQITMVQNNYSDILPNAPNYGIAPGALIIILGSALTAPGSQAVLQNPSGALPTSLNGSSVSVTVNGTTVHPAFYYACDWHLCNTTTDLDVLGVVLPSTTPVGTGTITVTYNNVPSAPVPIQIVAHAFGFDNYGGGLAAATDNTTGALITTSNSAKPGENIVFWGAGDGADTLNTDVSPPTNYTPVNGITAFYFGSIQVPAADLLYQGRSPYQGVDQINVTVPTNAPTGCAVSVSAVTGIGSSALSSNFVSLPIAAGGGTCVDPIALISPTEESTLSGKGTVRFGGISVDQLTDSSGVTDEAGAFFYSISGSTLTGYNSSKQPSLGSCVVSQHSSTNPVIPILTGLDAGTVSVQGPPLGTVVLANPETGIYIAGNFGETGIPNFTIPASGGNYTFTGTGGADVGPFTASVAFLNPLVWTNASSVGIITRSQGVTVTWTGGASGTYAEISGDSATAGFSASFICDAPVSAGTFTVPPAVLLTLPANDLASGSLSVGNYTNPKNANIPGVDFSYASAYVSTSIDATYN